MPKMKTSSKIIIIILSVFVVVALGYIIYSFFTTDQRSQSSQVESVTLEKGDLEKIVIADGQVRAEQYTRIYPLSVGVVSEILISEDDDVKADDLLMTLEIPDQTGGTTTQEIAAPIAGTVTNIWARLENQVSQAQNTPLLEIVDFDSLHIEGLLLESDVNNIANDQNVKLSFPALDDVDDSREYTGRVFFIAQSPNELETPNPVYRIRVTPDTLPEDIKFGMTVNMEIVVDEIRNVLYVENVYLFTENGRHYLTRLVDIETGRTQDVEVTLGFEGENETEILSGASENDKIVLPTIEAESFGPSFFGNNE